MALALSIPLAPHLGCSWGLNEHREGQRQQWKPPWVPSHSLLDTHILQSLLVRPGGAAAWSRGPGQGGAEVNEDEAGAVITTLSEPQ